MPLAPAARAALSDGTRTRPAWRGVCARPLPAPGAAAPHGHVQAAGSSAALSRAESGRRGRAVRLVSPTLADVGSDVITAPCYGVNVYVPPHSYVEVLTPM